MLSGQTVDNSCVLAKYTCYGDADLNGIVNFDDYSRTDSGFNNNRTGWLNGDYDGNGQVDFDGYSLIDRAFNTQGSALWLASASSCVGWAFSSSNSDATPDVRVLSRRRGR